MTNPLAKWRINYAPPSGSGPAGIAAHQQLRFLEDQALGFAAQMGTVFVDRSSLAALAKSGAYIAANFPHLASDPRPPMITLPLAVAGASQAQFEAALRPTLAALIAAFGPFIALRFGQEPNCSPVAWAANKTAASIRLYRSRYIAAHDLARALGWRGKAVWSMGVGGGSMAGAVDPDGGGLTGAFTLYPGDAYVDVIGPDAYDRWDGLTSGRKRAILWTMGRLPGEGVAAFSRLLGAPWTGAWPVTEGLRQHAAFARKRGKLFAVSEIGAGFAAGPFSQAMLTAPKWGGDNGAYYDAATELLLAEEAAGQLWGVCQWNNPNAAFCRWSMPASGDPRDVVPGNAAAVKRMLGA